MSNPRAAARIALVGVTVICAGCAAAPRERPVKMGPVETGAGTLAAARKYLEGRWSLISYEIRPPGQAPIELKGAGTLSYDEYGNLNMEIRVDPELSTALTAAGITTNNGVISTSGRTVVDMQARTLTYVLEGQQGAAAAGGPLSPRRPRHWQVDGDVLTLTTKSDDGQPVAVGRWRKAG